MNNSKLIFTYDEQEALCENGYSEELARATILLENKLERKDYLFVLKLHKIAKQLLEKAHSSRLETEQDSDESQI